MVLTISTTKLFLAEILLGDYNFHRWTSKPAVNYSANSKWTCKPSELHTIMKKCNGTGMVLKICETKNNVWKRYEISIQNNIDNHIEMTKIKLDSARLSSKQSFINGVNKPFLGLFLLSWCKRTIASTCSSALFSAIIVSHATVQFAPTAGRWCVDRRSLSAINGRLFICCFWC